MTLLCVCIAELSELPYLHSPSHHPISLRTAPHLITPLHLTTMSSRKRSRSEPVTCASNSHRITHKYQYQQGCPSFTKRTRMSGSETHNHNHSHQYSNARTQ